MREAINNLKEYVRDDDVYQRWSEGNITKVNDFDWYCIDHCNDINTVINGYNNAMKNMKELQDRIQKSIEFILVKEWQLEDIGVRYELVKLLKGERND